MQLHSIVDLIRRWPHPCLLAGWLGTGSFVRYDIREEVMIQSCVCNLSLALCYRRLGVSSGSRPVAVVVRGDRLTAWLG